LTHPIEKGVIKNWDEMQKIFDYGFERLIPNKNYNDYKVLLT